MKTNAVVYVLLLCVQLPLLLPLALVRVAAGLLAARRCGASNTALKVLETRALMHAHGQRHEPAAARLAAAAPYTGVWFAALRPLLALAARLARFVPRALRVPPAGDAEAASAVATRTTTNAKAVVSPEQIVALRSRVIDTALAQYLSRIANKKSNLRSATSRGEAHAEAQVVVLGAGYDCRAYSDEMRELCESGKLLFVELDTLPRVQLKQATLRRAGLAHAHAHFVAADFQRETFVDALKRAAIERFSFECPTFVVCEGLLYYLHEGAVLDLFRDFSSAFAPGSSIVADYPCNALVNGSNWMSRASAVVLELFGEPWLFGMRCFPDDEPPTRKVPQSALRAGVRRFASDVNLSVAEQDVCGRDFALFGGVARFEIPPSQ